MAAGLEPIEPYTKLTGQQRRLVAEQLAESYRAGHSIRQLMAESGRSYGAVHRLLGEAGVTLRTRGGNNRTVERVNPHPIRLSGGRAPWSGR
jgi:hypothetical protein